MLSAALNKSFDKFSWLETDDLQTIVCDIPWPSGLSVDTADARRWCSRWGIHPLEEFFRTILECHSSERVVQPVQSKTTRKINAKLKNKEILFIKISYNWQKL